MLTWIEFFQMVNLLSDAGLRFSLPVLLEGNKLFS